MQTIHISTITEPCNWSQIAANLADSSRFRIKAGSDCLSPELELQRPLLKRSWR